MTSQLLNIKSQLEESKNARRIDLQGARNVKNRLKRQVEQLQQQLDEADGCRRATQLAEARAQISQLQMDADAARAEAADRLNECRKEIREERDAEVKGLRRELYDARTAASRAEDALASVRSWHAGRSRQRTGPAADGSSQCISRFNTRLVSDLREFMDSKFDGGDGGEVSIRAVTAYLQASPETASAVVEALGVKTAVQEEFLDILKRHYSVENCAALFMHGNLTHAGYQAISNIMSGVYDNINDKFVRLMAPDGKTAVPRMVSLHVLLEYFRQCAEEFGVESVHEGQGGVLNVEKVLQSQVEHLLAQPGSQQEQQGEHAAVPEQIPVQLAADSAGWSKKPTHKVMKNFTAIVVRPILEKAGSDKVGDTINSCHNNRLAALYAGSDCHHLVQKFLNTSSTSSGQMVMTIRQQMEQLATRGLHTSLGDIAVLWRLGGDLKFLVECMGISSNAATYPCHQCRCHKRDMWMLPEEFPFGTVPQPRTRQSILQMCHAFGEEVGITEPYVCPGCEKEISAATRHKPISQEEVTQYGRQHFSHVWGKLPLTAVEPEDAVPDALHGFLRSVINMFFVGITMNLHTLAQAQQLSTMMEEQLQVDAEPIYSQRNRESTRKDLQSWNGKECWRVMANIGQIVDHTFQGRAAGNENATAFQRQLQDGYEAVSKMFSSFVELMAVWMMDVPEEDWQKVAQLMREKARQWRDAFVLASGSTTDCSPTMHSILYHYPRMYAKHGPIMRYSMQGLEAKHQPIKRAKKGHTNQKSFTHLGRVNAKGYTTVHAYSTDIMQVTKRMTVRDHICTKIKSGKGTRKRARSELDADPLSAVIKQLQQQYLLDLELADAE